METKQDRNAYRHRMENSFIAFADLLGFRDMLREAGQSGTMALEELLGRLRDFISPWNRTLSDDGEYSTERPRYWETKIFTDNLIISHPIRIPHRIVPGDHELGQILDDLSLFQFEAITKGFPVRGGIALGPMYVNNEEGIVFGVPLLNAYDAERCEAKWPRIIMTASVEDFIKQQIGMYRTPESTRYYRYVLIDLEDPSQRLFLNYLDSSIQDLSEGPIIEWVKEHRDVVRQLRAKFTDEKVKEKYESLARYHNFWCNDQGLNEYSIDGVPTLKAKRFDESWCNA